MRKNSGAAEVKDLSGRVVIRLPRNWFDGKQKSFPLGLPSTHENLAFGSKIAAQINADYLVGIFDATLAKYKQKPQVQQPVTTYSIRELWAKYCDYKKPRWKAKTEHYNLVTVGVWIERIPQDWQKALDIRAFLLRESTEGQAARVLHSIEYCLEWAMRVGLVPDQRNPYKKMGSDLAPKSAKSGANALTQTEQEQVITAFYAHPIWGFYGRFVEFLFLTGCRPSEAVGLQWSQIQDDFSQICFDRSVVRIGTEWHRNKLSKTNRTRIFYCNDRLQKLLAEIHASGTGKGAVFLVRGQYLDYGVFSKRAWKTIAGNVLGRDSTPYSTRDTFITKQTEAGKPVAIVAKWVDNSTAMIERKYLDTTATQSIKPD
jgi:integrase